MCKICINTANTKQYISKNTQHMFSALHVNVQSYHSFRCVMSRQAFGRDSVSSIYEMLWFLVYFSTDEWRHCALCTENRAIPSRRSSWWNVIIESHLCHRAHITYRTIWNNNMISLVFDNIFDRIGSGRETNVKIRPSAENHVKYYRAFQCSFTDHLFFSVAEFPWHTGIPTCYINRIRE